jgi:hypothetical protein
MESEKKSDQEVESEKNSDQEIESNLNTPLKQARNVINFNTQIKRKVYFYWSILIFKKQKVINRRKVAKMRKSLSEYRQYQAIQGALLNSKRSRKPTKSFSPFNEKRTKKASTI